jgi:DNA-binding SARP family transcriptional activator
MRSRLAPPRLGDGVIPRPRVERRLAELIRRRRIVILTATAGSGKTTAIIRACAELDRTVAWLIVDRGEQAPGRLLTYLEAAIAQRVPAVEGQVARGHAARLRHTEVAGLLAEAVAGTGLVLVLDDLERLGDEREAWQVLEAFLRYLPADTRAILSSRREIPVEHCALTDFAARAVLPEADLAFTSEEAASALGRAGRTGESLNTIIAATGGWVTGVLFGRWGAGRDIVALGGETDPLYEYLSAQILEQLRPAERDFLIATSLLDDVDAGRAEALGLHDAARVLTGLRRIHLPAVWSEEGRLRCHTYFREFLSRHISEFGAERERELRIAHAELLRSEGDVEEAVEVLLAAGADTEALEPAMAAIEAVVDRLDFAVAQRWLLALGGVHDGRASPLATAGLMHAIAHDDYARAVGVADRLKARGERDLLVRQSEHAACLMAWGYLHTGRFDDVDAILDELAPGPAPEAVRYAMSSVRDAPDQEPPAVPPDIGNGPLHAMIRVGMYLRGRLTAPEGQLPSNWTNATELPWRIAALRARGQLSEALEALELALLEDQPRSPALLALVGPELLIDAGRADEALELLTRGRERAAATGSLLLQCMNRIVEAKFMLRIRRDAEAAIAALERPECRRGAAVARLANEGADTYYGLALLLLGEDRAALERLRRAVTGMRRGDRSLELPTALTYLSEAAWRTSLDDEARRAADDAAAVAVQMGSRHVLLTALRDVPEVCARQLEATGTGAGEWRELGRALAAPASDGRALAQARVELRDLGERTLVVEGCPVHPRIAKTHELLAYLVGSPHRRATRDRLLDALFDSRRDDSARAYLRQATGELRKALPQGTLGISGTVVALDPAAPIVTSSGRLEATLAEAAGLQGAERLAATLAALQSCGGEFLPGPRSGWADERAHELAQIVTDARHAAASLLFGAGRYASARDFAQQVLREDPLRETTWRLLMRIAYATGDESGVLEAYSGCREALAPIKLQPAAATEKLLDRLRS